MNNRTIGLIIITLTVIFAIAYSILWNDLRNEIRGKATILPGGECIHEEGTQCPFLELDKINPLFYIGISSISLLVAFSLYLIIKSDAKEKIKSKSEELKLESQVKPEDLNLDNEEKKVYDLIKEADGSIFQSELVDKTGLSKVRVTRILDKLEGKKIIERKRRGMTNIVILKN